MHRYIAAGVTLAAALVLFTGGAPAADDLKSGPQIGENGRPKPFNPLNINGPTAGQKVCLV